MLTLSRRETLAGLLLAGGQAKVGPLATLPMPAHAAWADADLPEPKRSIMVERAEDVAAALAAARPGDHIVLADGVYGGGFVLTAAGTPEHPIVLRAARKLGATLVGDLGVTGRHAIIWGITAKGANIRLGGERNRLTRSRLDGGFRPCITLTAGQRCEIDHCDLTFSPTGWDGERWHNRWCIHASCQHVEGPGERAV